MLPEPRHAGVDLGPTPKEMKVSEDALCKASSSRGSGKYMYQTRLEAGQVGEGGLEKGNAIGMIVA